VITAGLLVLHVRPGPAGRVTFLVSALVSPRSVVDFSSARLPGAVSFARARTWLAVSSFE
jgi:hypothetical protein